MPIDFKMVLAVAGFSLSGDCGPYTMYTSKRHNVVIFDRAPPLSPPTAAQLTQRQKWSTVAADWKLQTTEEKATWERITQKLSLPLTGYNLFTFAETVINSDTYLSTVARQAGETLPPYVHI
jgi:hypothetical protein